MRKKPDEIRPRERHVFVINTETSDGMRAEKLLRECGCSSSYIVRCILAAEHMQEDLIPKLMDYTSEVLQTNMEILDILQNTQAVRESITALPDTVPAAEPVLADRPQTSAQSVPLNKMPNGPADTGARTKGTVDYAPEVSKLDFDLDDVFIGPS